jgi:hypothetical protein
MKYDTSKTNTWKKSGVKPKDIPKAEFIKVCNEHNVLSPEPIYEVDKLMDSSLA